jgi:hypothetical protein
LVPIAGIFVGFGLFVVIPVVAILTEHQRKMARILHGLSDKGELSTDDKSSIVIGVHASGQRKKETDDAVLTELRLVRNELADLRMQVAELNPRMPLPLPEEQGLRNRLS